MWALRTPVAVVDFVCEGRFTRPPVSHVSFRVARQQRSHFQSKARSCVQRSRVDHLRDRSQRKGRARVKRLLRRFGFYLLAAWVSLTLNFVLPRLMPGDPAAALMARFRGQISPEAMSALRVAFRAADQSLLSEYFSYLRHL